ncbi:MAG: hypothetical protein MJZ25_09355 [Fibrobacter sp.]|nr:hypothetical protein [Fibrobacter sp.]
MEVLVALAVLGASTAVFFRYIDGFQRQRDIERNQAKAFICSANAMEYLVLHVPSCATAQNFAVSQNVAISQIVAASAQSANVDCSSTFYSLSKVPGVAPLLVATVYTEAVRPVKLRRLIPCVNSKTR